MRTIRVTGKGQIKVKPDMTRITMTLTGVFKEYGETLRHSSEDTEALKDVLSAFGFERSDLKTLSFRVDTEYESYRDKNNDYKRRFVGYRFNHVLKVEFESDNDRLGKILYALANGKVRPYQLYCERPGSRKEPAAREGRRRCQEKGCGSDPGRRRQAERYPEHRLLLGRDQF